MSQYKQNYKRLVVYRKLSFLRGYCQGSSSLKLKKNYYKCILYRKTVQIDFQDNFSVISEAKMLQQHAGIWLSDKRIVKTK